MSWHSGLIYAYDCETTGIDVETDRIVTATLVKIDGSEVESREWLINPGVEIPDEATAVHGVTTLHARACGDDPAVACAQILTELDHPRRSTRPGRSGHTTTRRQRTHDHNRTDNPA